MANQEQLSILRKGIYFWDKWRNENPTEYIDLSGANLMELGLNKLDFDSQRDRGGNRRIAVVEAFTQTVGATGPSRLHSRLCPAG